MGFNNSTKMKILKLLVTSELRQLLVGSSGKAEEGRSLCSSLRRELLQGEQRPPGGKERRARKALWNHRQPQPSFKLQGSGLKDDIEALFVMPGCKLEVWDHGSGLEDAIKEERKGFNQGDYKNMKDLYDQNKLVFRADRTKPHWVEEINDDFDDMDEDIESFRRTCN